MQRTSWSTLSKRLHEYPQRGAIRKIVECIVKARPVVAVLLSGSLARGEYLEDSDIDLVVVLPEQEVPWPEALRWFDECNAEGLADILPFGHQQFARMLRDCNLLALDAVGHGILLHIGDTQKWAIVERAADEVLRRVRPLQDGWEIIQ